MKKFFRIILLLCVVLFTDVQRISAEDVIHVSKTPYFDAEDLLPYSNYLSLGYSYSSVYPANTMFPMALNAHTTLFSGYLLLSAEIGVNFDKKEYVNKDETIYDPCYYFMAGPGVNFQYFAFDCSFGALRGHDITEAKYYQNMGKSSFSTHFLDQKWYFICQPAVYGYIPLDEDDEFLLMLKVGYNIAPSFSEANGLTIGVGLKMDIELFE